MIDIPIPRELIGSDFEAEIAAARASAASNEYDETMSLALENGRGVVIECEDETAAQRQRFRFYRRKNELRAAGVDPFKKLVFIIEGRNLIIKVEGPLRIIEL